MPCHILTQKMLIALANVQYIFSPRFICRDFTLYTKYHHHSYITYTTSPHGPRLCKQCALCTTGQTFILMAHASGSFPGRSGCSVWKKYGLASIPLHHVYSKAQSAYGVGVLFNKQYSKAQSSTLNSPFKPCKFVEGQFTLSLACSSVMLPCFIKAYAILPPNTMPFVMEPYRRKKAPMIKAKRHTHLLLLTCNLLLLIQRLLFPVLLQLR